LKKFQKIALPSEECVTMASPVLLIVPAMEMMADVM